MFLGLLLAMLAASAHASHAKDEALIEAAENKFLRGCCTNTRDAAVCYDSLFPRASSFEGNLVKVTTAATIIAYEQLCSLDVELRSILRQGTGVGEYMANVLGSCLSFFEGVALFNEDSVLVTLRQLETVDGRKEKHAESDLNEVNIRVGEVASSTDLLCMEDFVRLGNGVLASPVGKIMVVGNATVTLYGGIVLDLVASIKL
ncbi:hypothetical protein QOZ80_6AG0539990 [Eleusine coracana subsp. coracana]|nr:hypothetical protein QOZ80_6AG0539990 [Eleusine coracana subsp. coracana]